MQGLEGCYLRHSPDKPNDLFSTRHIVCVFATYSPDTCHHGITQRNAVIKEKTWQETITTSGARTRPSVRYCESPGSIQSWEDNATR